MADSSIPDDSVVPAGTGPEATAATGSGDPAASAAATTVLGQSGGGGPVLSAVSAAATDSVDESDMASGAARLLARQLAPLTVFGTQRVLSSAGAAATDLHRWTQDVGLEADAMPLSDLEASIRSEVVELGKASGLPVPWAGGLVRLTTSRMEYGSELVLLDLFESIGSWLHRGDAGDAQPDWISGGREALSLYGELRVRFGFRNLLERTLATVAGLNELSWRQHGLAAIDQARASIRVVHAGAPPGEPLVLSWGRAVEVLRSEREHLASLNRLLQHQVRAERERACQASDSTAAVEVQVAELAEQLRVAEAAMAEAREEAQRATQDRDAALASAREKVELADKATGTAEGLRRDVSVLEGRLQAAAEKWKRATAFFSSMGMALDPVPGGPCSADDSSGAASGSTAPAGAGSTTPGPASASSAVPGAGTPVPGIVPRIWHASRSSRPPPPPVARDSAEDFDFGFGGGDVEAEDEEEEEEEEEDVPAVDDDEGSKVEVMSPPPQATASRQLPPRRARRAGADLATAQELQGRELRGVGGKRRASGLAAGSTKRRRQDLDAESASDPGSAAGDDDAGSGGGATGSAVTQPTLGVYLTTSGALPASLVDCVRSGALGDAPSLRPLGLFYALPMPKRQQADSVSLLPCSVISRTLASSGAIQARTGSMVMRHASPSFTSAQLRAKPALMVPLMCRPASVGAYELSPNPGRNVVLGTTPLGRPMSETWHGLKLAPVRGPGGYSVEQTAGFPDYQLAPTGSVTAATWLETDGGLRQYDRLMESRPWDVMWANRATRCFFFDPRRLTGTSSLWFHQLMEFQYKFRQAIWQLKHWIHIRRASATGAARTPLESAWERRYRRRAALDNQYYAAGALLMAHFPPEMVSMDPFFWMEPAVWPRPLAKCAWVVGNLAEKSLKAQLVQLDWKEPIHNEWAGWPGRFSELLSEPELKELGERPVTYELRAPWNDPAYVPYPMHWVVEGTPGPIFNSADNTDVRYRAWMKIARPLERVYDGVRKTFQANKPAKAASPPADPDETA